MKRKREFKREYVPVVIASILLVLLVIALIFAIFYDKDDFDINVPENEAIKNEILVDTYESLCDSKTIKKLYNDADKITLKYKEKEEVVGKGLDQETDEEVDVYGYVFDVQLTNITDDFYLVIKSDNPYEKNEATIKYSDTKKGEYTFTTKYTDVVVTYEVSIYTNVEQCQNELFRKFTFVTPIYNRFADLGICQHYKDFKWCKKFITEDVPSQQDFYYQLDKYIKKEKITTSQDYLLNMTSSRKTTKKASSSNNGEDKQNGEKTDNNTVIIVSVIAGVLVAIVIGTSVVMIRRRRK